MEFCAMQVVHEERLRMMTREPFWYPYTKARLQTLKLGTAALYGAAQVRDRVTSTVRDSWGRWSRRDPRVDSE